ncbi:MAG: hypothetical protein R2827_13115 [Bdellovibrionales bacterium]
MTINTSKSTPQSYINVVSKYLGRQFGWEPRVTVSNDTDSLDFELVISTKEDSNTRL